MKHINFITTLSPQENRALRTWWRFSSLLFVCVALGILVMQGKQGYGLYKTMKEHAQLQERMNVVQHEREPYVALKKEEEALRLQRTKVDQIYHTAERTQALLAALCATSQSVRVQSCKLNKKQFDLVVHCVNADAALNEVKRLRGVKDLEAVRLTALQKMQQGAQMVATIQGKVRSA